MKTDILNLQVWGEGNSTHEGHSMSAFDINQPRDTK